MYRMKIGLCFGGYCPLHQGHLDLIMRSKKENDQTYVVVCGFDLEPRAEEIGLPLRRRTTLIRQVFKGDEQIRVIEINDTEVGLDESQSLENWIIWQEAIKKQIGHNSDAEYKWYVGEPRYKHDILETNIFNASVFLADREDNLVSGTLIRKHPIKYWNKIALPFRQYFSTNILITGTASEGKSTLVKDIATYFGLPYMTEYGREYMEEYCKTDIDLTVNDFIEFLIEQRRQSREKIGGSGNQGIFISDTDNLVTLMYAWAYSEDPNINIDKHDYMALCHHAQSIQKYFNWDHIFVLTPNNTFIDDGTRYMAQSSIEERQKNLYKLNKLIDEFGYDKNKITYLKGGEFENNFNIIKEYINGIFLGN